MHTILKLHSTKARNRVWLYSVVFASKVSVCTVLLLFISFFFQPFHKAFANEAEAAPEPAPVAESVKTEAPAVEVAPEAVSAPVLSEAESAGGAVSGDDEDGSPDAAVAPDTSVVDDTAGIDTGAVAHKKASTSPTASATSEDIADESATVRASSTPVATTTSDRSSTTDGLMSDGGTTGSPEVATDDQAVSDDIIQTPTEAEPATVPPAKRDNNAGSDNAEVDRSSDVRDKGETSSTSAKETVVENRYLVTEQNFYQFSRQSCVAVGDGAYHCSSNPNPSVDPNSAVYAERDVDGDTEIYMRTSRGKVEQVTDNDFDDSSPHFDAESMRIVWQRLIDGRYQIISYDLAEDKETQLTFSRTNNMEPKASKDGIVWQAWDGHDWEVMYFDGTYTDQLTENEAQDVTPVIEDGYVVWSILGSENQEARVYSLETKQMMSITDHEGGTIVNPRFVLVYDTKYENGDIITQGFDPTTGISAPIAAQPAPDPVDIPDVDPIGEIKALIQNKSSQKENQVKTVVQTSDSGATVDIMMASSSVSADTLDLSLSLDDEVPMLPVATTTEQTLELTDFDLVITPHGTTSMGKVPEPIVEVEVPITSATTTQE